MKTQDVVPSDNVTEVFGMGADLISGAYNKGVDVYHNSNKVRADVDVVPKCVSEIMSEDIIQRAPDKMLQLVDGFLVLAWLNNLIIVNCTKLGIFKEQDDGYSENYEQFDLKHEQLQFLKLGGKYKIVTL